MEYTYDYFIFGLDVHPTYNGHQNVVSRVVYQITGTYQNITYSYQTADLLDYEILSNFIPYENLTKDIVVQWLETMNPTKIQEIKKTIKWELNKQVQSQTTYFENPFGN